jgi:hypothetical protein
MRPAIRSPRDFWAGAIYIAFGAAAVLIGRDYPLGSGARMGPGYFPALLGWLLMAIGALALGRSLLRKGFPVGAIAWRPLALVTGGTVLFGLLLRPAGAVAALAVLLVVSALASRQSRADLPTALAFAGLVAFCVAVFVKGLGVPMPILGSWFGE